MGKLDIQRPRKVVFYSRYATAEQLRGFDEQKRDVDEKLRQITEEWKIQNNDWRTVLNSNRLSAFHFREGDVSCQQQRFGK